MARLEELVASYKAHIAAPWQRNLAGPQKTIFVVYPKTEERRLRALLGLFEIATKEAGHEWLLFDFTPVFARWMAVTDYHDEYFREASDLAIKLETDFLHYAAAQLRESLTNSNANENTIVAAHGVACLYGFSRVSLVLKEVEHRLGTHKKHSTPATPLRTRVHERLALLGCNNVNHRPVLNRVARLGHGLEPLGELAAGSGENDPGLATPSIPWRVGAGIGG